MRRTIAAIAVAITLIGLGIGTARARNSTPEVGPGTSIGLCTITTAGHDAQGNAVALTAGHCMFSRGQTVYALGIGKIGHFVTWSSKWAPLQSDGSDDWAVIELDRGVGISVTAPNGAVLDHFGTPHVDRRMSKYGQITGTTTGNIAVIANNILKSGTASLIGDSGAPAYQGTGIVGLMSVITLGAPASLFWYSGIDGILRELNSRPGTIGYGFTIG
ncbi:S1 family peptidase [Nocardia sp. CA2R105]|uniref:S1 family peptidase n=1 Tax=Nocardia coffeae TaxID=2873381 RepID=UPI001CA72C1B|nr:S1 family peptidase [Nocardia coffeae]MBY8854875.1 S1 family peptidase [Nocardia coffeae]